MESTQENTFDISDFISILFQYFQSIDKYAEKIQQEKIKNEYFYKKGDDKFTIFDYIAQKLFNSIIDKFYPDRQKFLLIGEETITAEYDSLIVDNNQTCQEFLSEIENIKITKEKKEFFKIPEEFRKKIDITNSVISVFIDPIDATGRMVLKQYKPVTTMIGVCLDNEPLIGFLHYPFYVEGEHGILTYFNIPSIKGIFCFNHNSKEYNKLSINSEDLNKENDNHYKFIVSMVRTNEEMIEFMKKFPNYEKIHDGGVGNKVIRIINEDLIYFTTGKKTIGNWDICASSCILKSINAYVYTFKGEKLKFVPKKMYLEDNIVICLNKKKLEVFLDYVKKYYADSI